MKKYLKSLEQLTINCPSQHVFVRVVLLASCICKRRLQAFASSYLRRYTANCRFFACCSRAISSSRLRTLMKRIKIESIKLMELLEDVQIWDEEWTNLIWDEKWTNNSRYACHCIQIKNL